MNFMLLSFAIVSSCIRLANSFQCPAPNTVTMTTTETLEKSGRITQIPQVNIMRQSNTFLTFDNNGSNFNILNQLLSITGHSAQLHRPYPCGLTFFAASDSAIIKTVSEITGISGPITEQEAYSQLILNLSNRFQNPIFILSKILLFHMVPNAIPFQNLMAATVVLPTLSDDPIIFNAATNQLHDQNPALPDAVLMQSAPELWTMNGVIHQIDRLMLPISFVPEGTLMSPVSPSSIRPVDSESSVTVQNNDDITTKMDIDSKHTPPRA